MPYRVGFSSLDDSLPSVAFRHQKLREALSEYPDFELISRDNSLDDEKALANVNEFAAIPVNLAVVFHINERLGPQLAMPLIQKSIPIISVDVPIPYSTYFGANNQLAGELAGDALGRWVQRFWGGHLDKVLVASESRVTGIVRDRLDYALKGIANHVDYDHNRVLFLDCGSRRDLAAERSAEIFARWSDIHHVAVIGINDDSALGILDTARALGREQDIAVIGQGADEVVCEEIARPGTHFIASTDFHLGDYGIRLAELIRRIASKERVPAKNFIEHTCVITPDLS